MAKYMNSAAQDAYLAYASASTRMTFCSAQPANFAGIAAVALASVTPTFTGPGVGTPNGRQISVDAKSGVAVTATGTVLFAALDDGTVLRFVDTVPSQAVTSGGTLSSTAWIINAADPA
jgi:hypothetical protein